MLRRLLARPLLCIAVAMLGAIPARAQPAGDPRAAEALFAAGQSLMERHDYANACPKLEESYRLDPATGALFAVASCHEAQGLFASAWVEFLAVASRANAEHYSEREQEARQRVEALHAKLSFLTVEVDAAVAALGGLVVSRNGVRLGRAAWGTPLPVDPGRHVVEARAPGYAAFRGTIEIGAEPSKKVVVVPRLVPQAPPPHGNAASVKGSRGLVDELTPLRIAGIGLGGAAVASFGVATYATLRAADKYDDSKGDCKDNVCGVEGDRDRVAAQEAANLATVSAITGGVFLAAGAVLFVLGSPDDAKPGVKASASPTGFRIQGRF